MSNQMMETFRNKKWIIEQVEPYTYDEIIRGEW